MLNYPVDIQQQLETTILNFKKARTKLARHKIRLACHILRKAQISRYHIFRKVGISYSVLKSADTSDVVQNKKRSDAVPAHVVEKVQKYFCRGDVSWEDPLPRNTSAKTLEPTRFMERTLKETHNSFLKEHPEINISFSKFALLKPKRIKTIAQGKIRACKCELCCNVELKVEAINKFLTKNNCEGRLGSKYQVMEMTTCGLHPERHVANKSCIDRTCNNCGVGSLRGHLQQALDEHGNKMVTWVTWKLTERTYQNRHGVEATTTKRGPVEEEGPFDKLVAELERSLELFAQHLTNAQWQHKQFSLITENLPKNWIVMCMDFAENYTCYFQDEAQSAHWGKQQVTIHPIVAYYTCPEDGEAMKESFIFISEDLSHDSHAVHWFVTKVLLELTSRGVVVEKVIHFSDGCPSQYKGKVSFIDASFSQTDFGFPTEKHFFGSRHGKGPCDAEIGVIKRMVKQDIKRRKVIIRCAEDLYRSTSRTLTKPVDSGEHCHKKRSFLFVPLNTINRDRTQRIKDTRALTGSRTLHCVRGIGEYLLSHRERSCFCQSCVKQEGDCPNQEFTGEWQPFHLKKRRQPNQLNPSEDATSLCVVRALAPEEPTADSNMSAADKPTANADVIAAAVSTMTASSIEETKISVKLGDFVLANVFAESGKSSRQFVGCVKALRPDRNGVEVSFLKKQGASYHFPHIPDEALVLYKVLHDVHFDSRGHYFITF